jgi:hypothetical protein
MGYMGWTAGCQPGKGARPRGSGRTFAVEELDQQIGEVAVGQLFGGHVADEGVYLGRGALVLLRKRRLDRLGSRMGHNLGDGLGLCELLRELHDQPRDGDAARGPQELGLVRVLHMHGGCSAHDVLGVGLDVVALELSQLLLEVAHLELQVHDVVAGDLAALGGVVVLAVRIGALAGPAARQSGVASRLALGAVSGGQGRETQRGSGPTVRQRQQAVSVCAVRLWPLAPSSAGSVLVCVCVCVAVAASIVDCRRGV